MTNAVRVHVTNTCFGTIVDVFGDMPESEIGLRVNFTKQDARDVDLDKDKQCYVTLDEGKYSYA